MIDIVEIKVKAGNGGDGRVSFRREKFIAKGGPDGGDGGRGGDVYFVADPNMATLLDFNSKPYVKAADGECGGKKKMSGGGGGDLYVKVPVGTLVYERRPVSEPVLVADLAEVGAQFLIAKGGTGGKGNWHFRSSTNQVPMQYVPGGKGEEKPLKLEIKLVADVGLVGLPNAGKSTLINQLTSANVKVADYPFTTLAPNLGIYKYGDGRTIVLADIPGLIDGASQGKGLGDEFLRHVQRTRVLVHLIDPFCGGETPVDQLVQKALELYRVIRKELQVYGKDLESKEEIVVINKLDITEVHENYAEIRKAFEGIGVLVLGISGSTGEGITALMAKVAEVLDRVPKVTLFTPGKPVKTYTIENMPNRRMVFDDSKILTLK